MLSSKILWPARHWPAEWRLVPLALGCLLLGVLVFTAVAAPVFETGPTFGLDMTRQIAVADFNGDNALDFVAAHGTSASQLWLNNQDGTFSRGQTFALSGVTSVATGDLDGDNDPDLVLATARDGVYLWQNNGQGQFSPIDQPRIGHPNNQPRDIALADVDGDNDVDLFIANNNANELWLNNSQAIFTDSGQRIGQSFTNRARLVDINGDGAVDVITANRNGAGRVWLGDGTGSFETEGAQFGAAEGATDVAVADVNGDSDLDILFTGEMVADTLWLNNGGEQIGNFALSEQTFHTAGGMSVALADLDGDGDQDAVFGRAFQWPNTVWLNQGGAQNGLEGQFVDSGEALDVDGVNAATILADFDQNNSPDILFGNNGQDRLFWNTHAVNPHADVSIEVCCSGSEQIRESGFQFNEVFYLTIVNHGPAVATDVVVSYYGAFSNSANTGCETKPGDAGYCTIAQLNPGESISFETSHYGTRETYNQTYVGSLSELAYVSAAEPDNDITNNSDSAVLRFYDCEIGCFIEVLFCQASFARFVSQQTNTLSVSGERAFVPNLLLYYDVRSQMLTRAEGARYSALYNEHNQEVLSLVMSDVTRMMSTGNALALWEPHLRALVLGEGDTAVITTAQTEALDAFLTDITAVASPELQQAIATERANLLPLNEYAGLTMNEAALHILGPHTLHLPLIVQDTP